MGKGDSKGGRPATGLKGEQGSYYLNLKQKKLKAALAAHLNEKPNKILGLGVEALARENGVTVEDEPEPTPDA